MSFSGAFIGRLQGNGGQAAAWRMPGHRSILKGSAMRHGVRVDDCSRDAADARGKAESALLGSFARSLQARLAAVVEPLPPLA
jgi:hypothetical protein